MTKQTGKPESVREPIEGVFDDNDEGAGANGSMALTTVQRAPIQQVRTQYTTAIAVQKPRDIQVYTKAVLTEAKLAGEDFYYQWGQGQGLVEGVSIEGAMIMVRNYGNCAAESRVIEEGPKHWLIDASFIDLETGFTLARQYRQRKTEAHQKQGRDGDGDKLLDIAFQIGQSKSQRNVIVRAMPGWLVVKAMAEAKAAAKQGYASKLAEMTEKARVAFGTWGVTMAQLEAKVGKPTAAWGADEINILLALDRGIRQRETSVEREFPKGDAAPVTSVPAPQGPTANATTNATTADPLGATMAAAKQMVDTVVAAARPTPTAHWPTVPGTNTPLPACVACGKPVPGDNGVWVPPNNEWRHPGCPAPERAAQAPTTPAAAAPAAPATPPGATSAPPTQAAPAAAAAATPPERRRRAVVDPDQTDGEPPPHVKLAGDDDPTSGKGG